MLSKDLGIDLGTANVLIHVKGRGVVIDEPAVVAVDFDTHNVLKVGQEAKDMIGRTPGNISVIRPLRDGVIADFDITEAMLKLFVKKAKARGLFGRPRILICAPTEITSVEKKAIKEAAQKGGGGEIILESEPKAAAIGAGLDIFQPSGSMVIDIGGGTTDIAVLSMGDVVTANSLRVGGDKFDQAVMSYLKRKYNMLVGERTAEELKISIGTAFEGNRNDTMEVRGRDLVTGLPLSVTVGSEEVRQALLTTINQVVSAVKAVLEKTPPELAADIIDKGVVLTGGGAYLDGMDLLLMEEIKVPVIVAEDAMSCVVRGTGIMLENLDKFRITKY